MTLLIASLYLLCLAFLFGGALYIYGRDPYSRLNASFAVLSLALLGWVGTLFVFNAERDPATLLRLGRANFAAALLVAPAVLTFVRELSGRPLHRFGLLWSLSAVGALLCLVTGLVDRSELIVHGEHATSYGPLFGLYIAAIILILLVALRAALWPDQLLVAKKRTQLRLVGIGILATAAISVITNAVLPSLYGDFRFIHVGTLSTILFLGTVAYTVYVHGLFNIHVILRTTAVYALLIAFALELYQVAVEFLAHLLPLGDPVQQRVAAATIVFVINALSHEPFRKLLERITNRHTTKRVSGHRPS